MKTSTIFSIKLFLSIFFCCLSLAGFSQAPIQASGPLITTQSNVSVTMRDGVSVSLDIYQPTQNGTYPTLYASAPLPHSDDNLPPDNAQTGPVAWFVSQGFNYVIASTRGTGLSDGSYEFLARDEQQDHYEIIQWISEQAWSNGQILGVGADYYATSQWQMAIQNHPALNCIAPINGIVQPYQDWAFPGGLSSSEFLQDWYENTVRRSNAFPDSGSPKLVDFDMRLEMLKHPTYDNFWELRSSLRDAEAVYIPVFIADSWQRNNQGLSSNMDIVSHLSNIYKMAIYSSENPLLQDQTFLEQDLLPFYRWCLGDENAPDFSSRPTLRYQNQTQNLWRITDTWPPQEVEHSAIYLNRQSLDAIEPAALDFVIQANNISVSRYGGQTDANNSEEAIKTLTFISRPLASDIEIAGPILLELYASSSEADTAFKVELLEEINLKRLTSNFTLPGLLMDVIESATNRDETTNLVSVSSGSLKASMRSTVDGSVESFEPEYLFNTNRALRPSQTTRFDIALKPTAYRFKTGSRIILKITQAEDDELAGLNRQDSIFHSSRYPSRLWIPLLEGELRTMTDEELSELTRLSESASAIQNAARENLDTNFSFNTEFSSDLRDNQLSEEVLEPTENPVIFIRPNQSLNQSNSGATEEDTNGDIGNTRNN